MRKSDFRRSISFLFIIITLSACKKNLVAGGSAGTNYITLKIGTSTIKGESFFLSDFDESNNYELSNQLINFVDGNSTCFNFGGSIQFSSDQLNNIDYINSFNGVCNGYDVTQTGTRSTVTITRNDRKVNGIIQGSFSGVALGCRYLGCPDENYYSVNFSGQFKLKIVD